ncbi:BTB/POZ domain-containing protein KCTD16-like [Narcine bancroftii]|uniref:BTB/POZ domain-containing protein KCTD16-like n=1 Tax=Narcine bancroftii TaxID=1343680 RepID=UPI0038320472
MVVDYSQTINQYTQLDAYPLPRIADMINEIAHYWVFSTIDLKSVYHQISIHLRGGRVPVPVPLSSLWATNGVSVFQQEMDHMHLMTLVSVSNNSRPALMESSCPDTAFLWSQCSGETFHCGQNQNYSSLTAPRSARSGSSRWPSPHCECGCSNDKSERDGESVTSCNELSTSSCDSQSEASSPQETVICGPVTRQSNIQTLDRPAKKGPVKQVQQSEFRRKSDLLRTLTSGSRESNTGKKKVKEKLTIEEELDKCIQDFLKIKIPDKFPERKYPWQLELLRKYHL